MAQIDDSVKKSPQLRFEGFTDDWEERKLDLLKEQKKGFLQKMFV